MTNSRGRPAGDQAEGNKPVSGSAGPPNQNAPRARAGAQPSGPRGERFPKSTRLRARTDFDDLFQRGLVVVDQVLIIHARAASDRGRLGISIAKRVGHAPCRNRWKRLIREVYRRLAARSPALGCMDLLIRPRRGAEPSYADIERSLASLTSRLDRKLGRHDER